MLSSLIALSGLLASIATVEAAHEFKQHKRTSAASLYRRAGGFIPADGYETERKAPKEWAYEKLEPYELYHFRYIHIKCAEAHNTDFFEQCCHPRDADKLDDDFEYACRLEAHTDIKPKKLEKQMKEANIEASHARVAAIKSISSESYASAHPTTKKVHSHTPKPKPKPTSEEPAPEPTSTKSKTHHKPTSTQTPPEETQVETSEDVPPETTTKHKPTPKPKPTPTEEDTPEPEPTQDDGGNGGGIGGVIGDIIGSLITGGSATWFEQNGNPGSCGEYHDDSFYLVAIQEQRYNGGAECGRKVKVTNTANGQAVIALAADLCPSCQWNPNSLDLSLAAFDAIGARSDGVLPIEYGYVSPDTPLGPV